MARLVTCQTVRSDSQTLTCSIDQGALPVAGGSFFLFAIFCAWWAMTTRRNPWFWFFMGLFFAPITGLALLYQTSRDRFEPPA